MRPEMMPGEGPLHIRRRVLGLNTPITRPLLPDTWIVRDIRHPLRRLMDSAIATFSESRVTHVKARIDQTERGLFVNYGELSAKNGWQHKGTVIAEDVKYFPALRKIGLVYKAPSESPRTKND